MTLGFDLYPGHLQRLSQRGEVNHWRRKLNDRQGKSMKIHAGRRDRWGAVGVPMCDILMKKELRWLLLLFIFNILHLFWVLITITWKREWNSRWKERNNVCILRFPNRICPNKSTFRTLNDFWTLEWTKGLISGKDIMCSGGLGSWPGNTTRLSIRQFCLKLRDLKSCRTVIRTVRCLAALIFRPRRTVGQSNLMMESWACRGGGGEPSRDGKHSRLYAWSA